MKRLKEFITESIDDNLFWKIDTFFQNNDSEGKSFNGMIDVCRASKSFNLDTLEAYLKANDNLSSNTKKFVDFIEDNINPDTTINKDYSRSLYNIVKTVVGNKGEGMKYSNLV